MINLIQEILDSLKRNRMRTALTGFSVAWGIFMLIVLLGAGNGLIHAFEANSGDNALNVVTVYPGVTTKAYNGYSDQRAINLDNRDVEATENNFDDYILSAGALLQQYGITLSYGAEYVSTALTGIHPNYAEINGLKIKEGRFINDIDLAERRKSVVLHQNTADILFGSSHTSPVGKFVNAGGVAYQVVGVYGDRGDNQSNLPYIPLSTLQLIYHRGKDLSQIVATTQGIESEETAEQFEKEYRKVLAGIHDFDPADQSAVYISNRFTQYLQVLSTMNVLRTGLWVIGLLVLLSGVVGVSNIMLITVKERTREFGIRKALGAKPRSIYKLIIAESIVITALFGYIGLFGGIAATEWMDATFGGMALDVGEGIAGEVFRDPTVDISIALQATLTLIIAGLIAGLIPARKAANVRPIEALNSK